MAPNGLIKAPFNCGVMGDMARNATGTITARMGGQNGVFKGFETNIISLVTTANSALFKDIMLDLSLGLPTGPQNSPVTASCIIWRRTA